MSAAAFLDATHAELARLELEFVRTGDRMTALKLLLSSYAEEGETAPKRLPAPQQPRQARKRATPQRRPPRATTVAPGGPKNGHRPSWDVEAGRQLRAEGCTWAEIRDRLKAPVTPEAIRLYGKTHGWPEPAHAPTPGPGATVTRPRRRGSSSSSSGPATG
jgi:hypothetical protein